MPPCTPALIESDMFYDRTTERITQDEVERIRL
jgi:hypothetical protein